MMLQSKMAAGTGSKERRRRKQTLGSNSLGNTKIRK
jgi:hypothetical protein